LQNEGDSLEGGEADVSNRTKAWVASDAKHWQDPYASADEEYGPEGCSRRTRNERERGLRDLLKRLWTKTTGKTYVVSCWRNRGGISPSRGT